MDVKLLHSLPEDAPVSVSCDEESSYLSASDHSQNEKSNYPFTLLLIAYGYTILGCLFSLGVYLLAMSAPYFKTGNTLTDALLFDINVISSGSILPSGIYAPLLAVTGWGLITRKKWGIPFFAFVRGLSVSTALCYIIKFPSYFTIISPIRGDGILVQYYLQYGFLLIDGLLYLYLSTKYVGEYFAVSRKEILIYCVRGLFFALAIAGLITYFYPCIFGAANLKLGYANTRWFR